MSRLDSEVSLRARNKHRLNLHLVKDNLVRQVQRKAQGVRNGVRSHRDFLVRNRKARLHLRGRRNTTPSLEEGLFVRGGGVTRRCFRRICCVRTRRDEEATTQHVARMTRVGRCATRDHRCRLCCCWSSCSELRHDMSREEEGKTEATRCHLFSSLLMGGAGGTLQQNEDEDEDEDEDGMRERKRERESI